MSTESPYKEIITRIHPEINARLDAYNLIIDSFYGGIAYIKKDHLFKYPKENSPTYDARKSRSVFLNHTAPIVETLIGLLFDANPTRDLPENLKSYIEAANKRQSFQEFFQEVATKSLLNTCAILVDSPSFNPEEIKTKADQESADLRPYLVLYELNKIRDFALDENGILEWVLLDNTYEKDSNPFHKRETIKEYRLWTTEYYQVFTIDNKGNINASEIQKHPLKRVPILFISWSDNTKSIINQTLFEDIALMDKKIYNYLSIEDEIIYSNAFKILTYPGKIPDELEKRGIGNLDCLTYDPASSHEPSFKGPGVDELAQIGETIDRYAKKILQKVGLDKDEEKSGVQSGVAKNLEYRVAKAFLLSGATRLEKTEKECFRLISLWHGEDIDPSKIKIVYPKKFETIDLDTAVKTLLDIFDTLKYTTVKKLVAKEVVRRAFPGLSEFERNEIYDDIDSTDENELPSFIQKAIDQSNNTAVSSDNEAKITNGSSTEKGTKSNNGRDPDNSANG
ncbi:hypothetical protein LEP1GSC161_0340 [Leptospira santarosai str. CBC1416]|uniref:DUF4055 domain-containing protein n=1 Tax=Leptospira santarosai str. CBC1416 TaxID=1193059 RepID=M6VJV3_9LEPT|nr:hypothetical protein LEP1GSC161_0340 [Leptospira santarosai str. CBC1416]